MTRETRAGQAPALHTFIHLGDTHLGAQGGRQSDRLAALDRILAEGSRTPHLAAWLWPGDLFHQRSEASDRNALTDRLQAMADVAPVVLVYGNHDLPGELEIFGRLRTNFPVYVAAQPQVLQIRLATGSLAAVACLPYPAKAGLIGAGTTADETLGRAQEALAAIVRGLAAELDQAAGEGLVTLTIGHLNIGGAIASVGQPQIGKEIELDPLLLTWLTAHGYVGLNHIHKPQDLHGAYFAGSIAPMDFGEMEAKRYLAVTYGPRGWGGHAGDGPWASAGPTWDYDFISRPLDVPQMYHVEGTLTREGFTWSVTRGLGGEPVEMAGAFAGADVRIRYTFRPSERESLNFDLVRAPFAGARLIKLEATPLTEAAVRAPAVATAHTLIEKVRAACDEQGTPVTPGLIEKVAQIEAEAAARETEQGAASSGLPLEPARA